jgi:hypothetical protein
VQHPIFYIVNSEKQLNSTYKINFVFLLQQSLHEGVTTLRYILLHILLPGALRGMGERIVWPTTGSRVGGAEIGAAK